MRKGQKSVREGGGESGKASWRRWHLSWSLKDGGGKVKCVPSFDHLLNKCDGSACARQCAWAEDVFVNRTGKFPGAGVPFGAADNRRMHVRMKRGSKGQRKEEVELGGRMRP